MPLQEVMRFKFHSRRRSIMRRLLLATLLTSLLISPVLLARNGSTPQRASSQKKFSNQASAGFYLEIKRSYVRAYPGWQKKTISLLKLNGIAAFNGEPHNRITTGAVTSIESLEETSRPKSVVGAVYVGPYASRAVAEQTIPELLLALKPLINREKKHDELHNRYLFLVGVVEVSQSR
jgi:hypothetical protein